MAGAIFGGILVLEGAGLFFGLFWALFFGLFQDYFSDFFGLCVTTFIYGGIEND